MSDAADTPASAPVPPALRAGDRVRVVSPASYPSPELLELCCDTLRSWDLVPEVGRHATARHGYMAGRDEDRLADLDDAFRDPGVRAVVTTRGGAGAYRIADRLDVEAVRRDPKPLVGFSDVTHLHLALWRRCRVPSVHGWLVGDRGQAAVRHLLTSTAPTTLVRDPDAYSAQVEVAGHARGPLVGGNLTAVAGEVGTGLLDLTGCLLLLEDFRGVVLGRFAGFEGYRDRDWELLDVLRDHLVPLGVPVLGGFDIGHTADDADGFDQDAVALGTTAALDTADGTLTVDPCVR